MDEGRHPPGTAVPAGGEAAAEGGKDLRRALEDLRSIERQGAAEGLAGLGALLAVLLLVAGGLYGSLRENFTPERLRESALIEAQALAPGLAGRAGEVVREVAPVYVDAARRGIESAGPAIADRFRREASILGDIAANRVRTRFERAITLSLTRFRHRLSQGAPPLADEDFNRRYLSLVNERVRVEMRGLLTEVVEAYTQPAMDLLLTADRMPRIDGVSEEQLRREYLDLWLELFQVELASGDPVPRTDGNPQPRSARGVEVAGAGRDSLAGDGVRVAGGKP